MRHGVSPNIHYFRVWGCICYVLMVGTETNAKGHRFAPTSKLHYFLGYEDNVKGYRVYDPITRKVKIRKHIRFDESEIAIERLKHRINTPTNPFSFGPPIIIGNLDPAHASKLKSNHAPNNAQRITFHDDDVTNSDPPPPYTPSTSPPSPPPTSSPPQNITVEQQTPPVLAPQRARRTRRPPERPFMVSLVAKLNQDCKITDKPNPKPANACDNANIPISTDSEPKATDPNTTCVQSFIDIATMNTPNSSLLYPSTASLSHAKHEYALTTQLASSLKTPKTFKQAMASPQCSQWREAIKKELDSMKKNHVWRFETLPPNRQTVGSVWVFRIKQDANGNVSRFKARLCAQGFTQQLGIDFVDTFAPVARHATIRTLLAIAAKFGLILRQFDIKCAFLASNLNEEIYMRIPDGLEAPSGKVLRLLRGMYGLKQAGRIFAQTLSKFLISIGFIQSDADPCLYVRSSSSSGVSDDYIIIAVFVDDLVVATSKQSSLEWFRKKINNRFEIGADEPLSWCLGMKITRPDKHTITLSLERYIKDVLERFNMTNCAAAITPAAPSIKLSKEMEPSTPEEISEMKQKPFRSLVGSLMYASVTVRADIAHAVGSVARYMSNPGVKHWIAAKRILRYLKGTASLGLTFHGTSAPIILGFADSDWAGDLDKRRSCTGFCFAIGSGAIAWRSRLQPTVALSSAEAEYMAVTDAATNAIWLRRLLTSLGFPQSKPTDIRQDNQACICMAKDPVAHRRTKHIDIKHHFIRQAVDERTITVTYCPTREMIADMLTKALASALFLTLRTLLLGQNHPNGQQ